MSAGLGRRGARRATRRWSRRLLAAVIPVTPILVLLPDLAAADALAAEGAAAPAAALFTGRVLLQPVEAVGAVGELAASVETAVLLELSRRSGIDVISPAELEEVLRAERENAELGCDELDACLMEANRVLGAEWRVALQLVQFGSEYELTLTLLNMQRAAVVRRVEAPGTSWADLSPRIPQLVSELLGAEAARAPFALPADAELKLALLPLSASGVSESAARAMNQVLAVTFSKVRGVSVLSRDDVQGLSRAIEQQGEAGCTDDFACIAEIGAELGLSKVVAGSVGRVGETHVVALRLIDTRSVKVLHRVMEDFEGDALELRHATRKAALDLLGVSVSGPPGGLDLTLNAAAGHGRLGERELVFREHRLSIEGLTPGRYPLQLFPEASDDYLPLRRDLYVPPGGKNARTLLLEPAPARWYAKWWVWAVAVGLVAASAATALALTHETKGPEVVVNSP